MDMINKFLITEKKRGEQFVVPLFLFLDFLKNILTLSSFKCAKIRREYFIYVYHSESLHISRADLRSTAAVKILTTYRPGFSKDK